MYCEGCARIAEEQNNIPRIDGEPRPGYHVYLRHDMPPLPADAQPAPPPDDD